MNNLSTRAKMLRDLLQCASPTATRARERINSQHFGETENRPERWPAITTAISLIVVASLMALWTCVTPFEAPTHVAGAPQPVGDTYRVIGIRADGRRLKLQGALPESIARELKARLNGAADFPEIQLELESHGDAAGRSAGQE